MRSVASKIGWWLVLALALGLSGSVAAALPDGRAVPAGGIAIAGETTPAGSWMLTVAVGESAEKAPPLLAILVISQPSGTVLSAHMAQEAEGLLLREVLAMNPREVAVGTLDGSVGVTGMPPPPEGDNTVVVKVLREEQGTLAWTVATEAHLGDLAEFTFVIESGGGGFRTCFYCGALFCGCITCATPGAYKCCPGCEISCQPLLCP